MPLEYTCAWEARNELFSCGGMLISLATFCQIPYFGGSFFISSFRFLLLFLTLLFIHIIWVFFLQNRTDSENWYGRIYISRQTAYIPDFHGSAVSPTTPPFSYDERVGVFFSGALTGPLRDPCGVKAPLRLLSATLRTRWLTTLLGVPPPLCGTPCRVKTSLRVPLPPICWSNSGQCCWWPSGSVVSVLNSCGSSESSGTLHELSRSSSFFVCYLRYLFLCSSSFYSFCRICALFHVVADGEMLTIDRNLDWKLVCFNIAKGTSAAFLQNCTPQNAAHQGNLGRPPMTIHWGRDIVSELSLLLILKKGK